MPGQSRWRYVCGRLCLRRHIGNIHRSAMVSATVMQGLSELWGSRKTMPILLLRKLRMTP